MADDTARAVGAGGQSVTVNGKECRVRGLTIRELAEVERECLEAYKRSYLSTFAKNADLLPDNQGYAILEAKMEKAARWDVNDLPIRYAYDPDRLQINGSLESWIKKNLDYDDKDTKGKEIPEAIRRTRMQRLTAAALDSEMLTSEDYTKMTGQEPKRTKVGYVNWWITGSFDGMLAMIWVCFQNQGVTKDELMDEIGRNPALMIQLSREIETLSAPAAGNG